MSVDRVGVAYPSKRTLPPDGTSSPELQVRGNLYDPAAITVGDSTSYPCAGAICFVEGRG